ncbi:MAG: hypothetical protein OQK82_00815 [Candidatus Pacearchaeota archaeon]|nr:hypothetical protein [Candidatus Pacearchaeota archaeon]
MRSYNIKNIILGISIFILTLFVTIYGINTFYPRPQYNDFCDNDISKIIQTEQECIDQGGKWNYYQDATKDDPTGYCNQNYYCSEDYNDAREKWTQNVFFIALPIGIIILALGAFALSLEPVVMGLMSGGTGTLLYGTWGFFWQTNDKMRFIISCIGLAVVIFLAYYFNKRFEKKSKKKK